MIPIPNLKLGFNDAENYKRRENKEFFNHIFVRNESLNKLCEKGTFFLIGEKGTGKTAYAVYISNNSLNNHTARISFIRETDYQKFVSLKQENHLVLSDYTNIWKVIIYLLMTNMISGQANILQEYFKFRKLFDAVREYHNSAFSPEIINAISFVENSKAFAETLHKYFKVGSESSESITFVESRFQTNLLYIQRKFEEALNTTKLSKSYILFIDGIDIRPSLITYDDYLECVKGLANAVWSINNDFFSGIRDSVGRMKVVLLIRPDIFDVLGLQNTNNKYRDNSVLLDWRTTYQSYINSSLFEIADKLLSSQQQDLLNHGYAWDYYFPYKVMNKSTRKMQDTSFIPFLRYSMYRPRDIITMLQLLKNRFILERKMNNEVFNESNFNNPEFRRNYSDYLLGEIKDHLSFYYTSEEYELFLKFFQYLLGKAGFSYEDYLEAYQSFQRFIDLNSYKMPNFAESADKFLQFLYDLNVIGYELVTDDKIFIHWCFRDRTTSNLSPKVMIGERYKLHYGLTKALNVGKRFIARE